MLVNANEDIDELREDILKAMTQGQDATQRALLSIMLRMMSTQQKLLSEMVDRLDKVIEDKDRIKQIVLEHHLAHHGQHHDWLFSQLTNRDEVEYAIKWAASKMKEELDSRVRLKKTSYIIFERLLTAGLLFLAGFHFHKFFPQLFGV
jgi:predicted NodU family carbamoyl transferase